MRRATEAGRPRDGTRIARSRIGAPQDDIHLTGAGVRLNPQLFERDPAHLQVLRLVEHGARDPVVEGLFGGVPGVGGVGVGVDPLPVRGAEAHDPAGAQDAVALLHERGDEAAGDVLDDVEPAYLVRGGVFERPRQLFQVPHVVGAGDVEGCVYVDPAREHVQATTKINPQGAPPERPTGTSPSRGRRSPTRTGPRTATPSDATRTPAQGSGRSGTPSHTPR